MIIKEFPTLYTLDSRNKVRIFECKVDSRYNITTSTGLVDGKKVDKLTMVDRGKQGRSIEEQAIFEANKLWEDKQNEGYKSKVYIEDFTIQKFESIDLISLSHLFCTNINGDELPMLAKKFKDIKNPEYPYFIQPKLNGVRCLAKLDGDKVKLISRGGIYYEVKHLEEQISILLNKFIDKIILDGEIYKHGVPLQDISGAARKQDSNSLFKSNEWLEYHIYDIIDYDNLDMDQGSRINRLEILGEFLTLNVKIVNTFKASNGEQAKMFHDRFVSGGYEGAILRDMRGTYQFNQRSKYLLKFKEYQDSEFLIMGHKIDSIKSIEDSFVFVLKNDINDLIFEARPTGTATMKRQWYENIGNYIGKKATVRYFERSKDGLPLQANVRSEKTPLLIEHIRPQDE